jgi:hypothetical protein
MVFPPAIALGSRFFLFNIKKNRYCRSDEFLWKKKLAKKNLIFKLFSIKNYHIKKHYVTFEA